MNQHSPGRRRRWLSVAVTVGLAAVLFAGLLVPAASAKPKLKCEGTRASVSEFPVAVSSALKAGPHTDGSSVVWSDNRNGSFDVFSFDLGAQTESPVVTDPGDQTDPVVSDGAVFWVDQRAGGPVIVGYDPAKTPSTFDVSTGPGTHPAADCTHVVWTDQRGADLNIYGYNRETGQEFPICTAAGDQQNPAVSGNLVVWQDDRNGNWDIYAYNLDTQQEFAVCTADGNQTNPAVCGDTVVWQDNRNGNSDVYGRNVGWLSESAAQKAHGLNRTRLACWGPSGEFPICTADGDQVNPTITDRVVAWEDYRNGADNADIFGFDLRTQQEFAVCTADGNQTDPASGGGSVVVTWLDTRNGGTDVYGANVTFEKPPSPPPIDDWTSSRIVKLLLSAIADLGVFDEYNYSLDNGATWASDTWLTLDCSSDIQLPPGDGPKTVYLKFANSQTGVEVGPIVFTVWVDSKGPVTEAVAKAVVKTGKIGIFKLMVREKTSPKATVTVVVKNLHGKVVKIMRFGKQPTNRMLAARFRCTLRSGKYRYQVLAVDLAGNRQVKVGWNWLLVR
jgi:beta propeller repeat protein